MQPWQIARTDLWKEEKKEKAVSKPTDSPILFLASPTDIFSALPTPRADRRRILGEGSPPTDIPTGIPTRYHDNDRKLQKSYFHNKDDNGIDGNNKRQIDNKLR